MGVDLPLICRCVCCHRHNGNWLKSLGPWLSNRRCWCLDEPTSSLGRRECEQLYGVVRRLAQRRVGIIFISHFLEECRDLADHVLVLRDGTSVAGGLMSDFDHDALVAAMVGRSVE